MLCRYFSPDHFVRLDFQLVADKSLLPAMPGLPARLVSQDSSATHTSIVLKQDG